MKPVGEQVRTVSAIDGLMPEELAHAMSSYSKRSGGWDAACEAVGAERTEEFLNRYYLQYGHASIADMAHFPIVLEGISMLAAVEVCDEQVWDGQERSSRYQDFSESGYVMPDEVAKDSVLSSTYRTQCELLFDAYNHLYLRTEDFYRDRHYGKSTAPDRALDKRISSMSFDVARYALPFCTSTSMGQVVSARTLRRQVARLMASKYGEVARIGFALQAACTDPSRSPVDLRGRAVAPTLAQSITPDIYGATPLGCVREALGCAKEDELHMDDSGDEVELVSVNDPVIETIAKLFYSHSPLRFATCVREAEELTAAEKKDLLGEVFRNRSAYDFFRREFRSSRLVFDVRCDMGAYRDLHRHRRTVQLRKPYSPDLGYATPPAIAEIDLADIYKLAMQEALCRCREFPSVYRDYLLPLATCVRSLHCMDIEQLFYISELRTRPGGHFSYRNIAHEMCRLAAAQYPELAGHFRVSHPLED
jgi:thymidylate synthase ThyX